MTHTLTRFSLSFPSGGTWRARAGLESCPTFLVLVFLLTGCAVRKPPVPVAALQPIGPSFIDLQPGWRLRVVTPILKSGGYRLKSISQKVEGNNVTLTAGDDFLGYEVAYYSITARHGVEFVSAETTRNGHARPQPRPVAQLFQLPRGMRHVRLVYLVRVSQADHDMAVVAATDMEALESLTRRVESYPTEACHGERGVFCAWIPVGIAVVPQFQKPVDGGVEWVPAR